MPSGADVLRAAPSVIMQDINASIGFDRKMWRQDIRGSLAHAAMLVRAGVIAAADESAIKAGLADIAAEIDAGRFPFVEDLEDIHMNIESRLVDRIGEAGKRLHTARSRNDQVATDFRLWVRDSIDGLDAQAADLMRALADRAAEHAADPMPGFTHLQTAQPVTFGHHLLAYVEMLARDRGRLADARRRLNECPLGSAALAGTSFPIDRTMTAGALGFDRPTANSLDAVSDRDFALEFLAAAAICAMHLSRLAEEIIIWCSAPFGFIRLSDAFTTGSSIMPQKAQPGRGRAGPGQDRAGDRRAGRAADGHEGVAARVCEGHAGGQGAGVRRRRRAFTQPRGDGGDGAGPHGRHGADAGDGGQRVCDGDGPGGLAGAGAEGPVPDGASCDGPAGGAGGGQGRRSCGAQP